MKRRIVAVMLAAAMTASLMTACGGGSETQEAVSAPVEETADVEEEAPEEEEAETEAEAGAEETADMVSDENFAILQENFELISDYASQVREIYTSDEIAANPDIEDVILQSEDLIAEIGEIEQSELTEEDAQTLNDAMALLIETYDSLLEGMELVDDGSGADGGEMVSDETFAQLGEAYDSLTELYNMVATAYNDSELEVPEVKEAMDGAYDLLEQMGDVTQDTITEEDAETLAQAMIDMAEGLELIAEGLAE